MQELAASAHLWNEPESTVLAAEALQDFAAVTPPVGIIVPVRNERRNLRKCLESLRDGGEVYVIDSQITDDTVEIARSIGAQVVQFHYHGGWPKTRQWALDMLPLQYEWVLLLDADESPTPALAAEMKAMRGVLPPEVLHQPKAGFAAPTDYWLANELKEMTDDLLTDSRTKSRGLFSAEAVQKLIREHRSGKRDWSMQIWQLLTIELWTQNFIDGASGASTHESMRAAIA